MHLKLDENLGARGAELLRDAGHDVATVPDPSNFFGIAVLRLPHHPTPEDLLMAIQTLIGGVSDKNVEGKLWIVQRGKIREYQPDN